MTVNSFSSTPLLVTAALLIVVEILELVVTTAPGNILGVYEEHRPSSVQPKEVIFNRGRTSPLTKNEHNKN